MFISSEPLAISPVRLSVTNAGIKQTRRPDMCLIEIPDGSTCAAVFTKNRFAAAPVILAKQHLHGALPIKYLLINSGNANCGTGNTGISDAQALCRQIAQSTGNESSQVLPFSTGVIGQTLPLDRMLKSIPTLVSGLAAENWAAAAEAIMTTDTRRKIASCEFEIGGNRYAMTGIAKGAGMIKPDMATMLSFIATNATVSKSMVHTSLLDAVDCSFNRITIDGDTSTNDACVLIAAGVDEKNLIDEHHPEREVFTQALAKICDTLAKAIVADGEGATKFVEVAVASDSLQTSKTIALTVAESPLVKTALFASDPNWGRILAAIGRAPVEPFDINRVEIFIGDYQIVKSGCVVGDYQETEAARRMAEPEIKISINIGSGTKSCSIWTCDLSYDYVKINAEYRS